MLLRPWFYKNFPSVPAFRNERVIVLIEDVEGELWALSIVGGPGVGTISLTSETVVGGVVKSGDELAIFKLGSTCCLVSPYSPKKYATGQNIIVGTDF
jgi:phosphatidylserine decarboxylase